MSAYLIFGLPGTGKSTVATELIERGYTVIETDLDEALCCWVNIQTGLTIDHPPAWPYSAEWVDTHRWSWDERRLRQLLAETSDCNKEPVFFCGSAHNVHHFYHLFTNCFGLYINTPTMINRLQRRDPFRWHSKNPELHEAIRWNDHFYTQNSSAGVTMIEGTHPPDDVTATILSHTQRTAERSLTDTHHATFDIKELVIT